MTGHNSNLFLLFFIFAEFFCLSSSIPSQYSIMGPNLDKLPTQDEDPSQYSIMGPILDKLPTQDEAIQLFQQWKKEHGRVYKDLEELGKRFEIFLSNLNHITESNAKRRSPSSYLLGLNNFADWSAKELKETYLHKLDLPIPKNDMKPNDVCTGPSSLDWRSKGVVTPVKNQKSCGGCWAFSATGSIEGIVAITTGKLVSLSEQELLDCDTVSHGCNGGRVDAAFKWILSNGGIASEADYPFTGTEGSCKASQIPNSASIDGYGQVTARSDDGLFCAVLRQPVSVYFNVTNDFFHYKSGVYDGPYCLVNSTSINHAMLIVGYDSIDGEDYWIVKNSWNVTWGIKGYAWIKRKTDKQYGVCGINAWNYYPIKESRNSISDV